MSDQCLVGASPQHAAGRGASGRDRRQRVRRPLHLQPLPVRARGAGLCDRARPRRHRILSGLRRLAGDARLSSLCPRLPSRIRAQSTQCWLDNPARPLLLPALRRRAPSGLAFEIEALRRQVAVDIEAYLASDVDYPGRHGGGVLDGRHAHRRRADGVPRLALRRRDLDWSGEIRAVRAQGARRSR